MKHYLNATIVASLALVLFLSPARSQAPVKGVKNIVLVHGAFADRSSKYVLQGINLYFAQDLSPEDRQVLFATQIPWAARGTVTKISKAAWKDKRSWCIIGLNDETVPSPLTRAEAKMIHATTLELRSSHVPMLSQPDKVAGFIVSAAQKL